MIFNRDASVVAGAQSVPGILILSLSGLLSLPGTGMARAEPVRHVAQRDVAAVGSVTRPVALPKTSGLRPAIVVREHLWAQQIIDRMCMGC